MASRLYRTTLPLYLAVERVLLHLGAAQLGSPTLFGLIALTVSGLILLDARQTQTRVSALLPARAHDALNRLLRALPLSTRALMRCLIYFAANLGQEGYLTLDEVIVEKAFARGREGVLGHASPRTAAPGGLAGVHPGSESGGRDLAVRETRRVAPSVAPHAAGVAGGRALWDCPVALQELGVPGLLHSCRVFAIDAEVNMADIEKLREWRLHKGWSPPRFLAGLDIAIRFVPPRRTD